MDAIPIGCISSDFTREDAKADEWEDRVCRHMAATGIEDFDDAERDLREADAYDETERMLEKELA